MVVYMLTIPKFLEYNSRKDVKNPSWFRMENRFLESVTGALLSNEEIIVWLYLLSERSKSKHHMFKVSSLHAALLCKMQEPKFDACLKRLHACDMVELNGKHNGNLKTIRNERVTRTVRGRNEDVTDAGVTLHNITRHNITEHNKTNTTAPDGADDASIEKTSDKKIPTKVVELAKLWNEIIGQKLTNVIPSRFGPSRVKHATGAMSFEPSMDVWSDIFKKVSASDFLCGSSGKWRATFDWVIKPDNAVKILEGTYDNKNRTPPQGSQKYVTIEDLRGDAS